MIIHFCNRSVTITIFHLFHSIKIFLFPPLGKHFMRLDNAGSNSDRVEINQQLLMAIAMSIVITRWLQVLPILQWVMSNSAVIFMRCLLQLTFLRTLAVGRKLSSLLPGNGFWSLSFLLLKKKKTTKSSQTLSHVVIVSSLQYCHVRQINFYFNDVNDTYDIFAMLHGFIILPSPLVKNFIKCLGSSFWKYCIKQLCKIINFDMVILWNFHIFENAIHIFLSSKNW